MVIVLIGTSTYIPSNSNGLFDVLVIKYSSEGNPIWVNQYGMNGYSITVDDIVIDNSHSAYVTGHFTSCIFGNDTLTAANDNDIYIHRIDSSGTILWTKQYGVGKSNRGYDLKVDGANNVYVSGYTGIYSGNFIISSELLVMKYDDDGTQIWCKQDGGSLYHISSLDYDIFGNIYVLGSVNDEYATSTFDTITVYPTSDQDVWLGKLGSLCFDNPITAIMKPTHINCYGDGNGSVQVIASGGEPPYTYLWDPGTVNQTDFEITGLSAGTYYVTVVDNNGCAIEDSAIITEPLPLDVNFTITPDNGDCTGSITVNPSGGTPDYLYQWDEAANNQTTQTANDLCSGTYYVTITDENNCSLDTSATVNVVGIHILENELPQFSIFSNPGNNIIKIKVININNPKLIITNLNGQVLYSKGLNKKLSQIDISGYPQGVYFIRVKGEGFIKSEKVVIY